MPAVMVPAAALRVKLGPMATRESTIKSPMVIAPPLLLMVRSLPDVKWITPVIKVIGRAFELIVAAGVKLKSDPAV